MRRGGLTRLVQQLGVTLVILELAHVPLPAPEYRLLRPGERSAEVCSNPDHLPRIRAEAEAPDAQPALHWRWAPLVDDPEGDEDEVAVAQAGDDHPGACEVGTPDCSVAPTPRSRVHHHFVRGHSKGLHKVFADRSTFVGHADERHAGLRPAAIGLDRAPLAAMLQRWRC